MHHHFNIALSALSFSALCHAQASEPVTVIDQARAYAGSVSPGDAPGFPVTLGRSGHYRLAGDLVVPVDTSGIVISAQNVTLDLGGHTVGGPVQCNRDESLLSVQCSAASRFSAVVGISRLPRPAPMMMAMPVRVSALGKSRKTK